MLTCRPVGGRDTRTQHLLPLSGGRRGIRRRSTPRTRLRLSCALWLPSDPQAILSRVPATPLHRALLVGGSLLAGRGVPPGHRALENAAAAARALDAPLPPPSPCARAPERPALRPRCAALAAILAVVAAGRNRFSLRAVQVAGPLLAFVIQPPRHLSLFALAVSPGARAARCSPLWLASALPRAAAARNPHAEGCVCV